MLTYKGNGDKEFALVEPNGLSVSFEWDYHLLVARGAATTASLVPIALAETCTHTSDGGWMRAREYVHPSLNKRVLNQYETP